MIGPLKHRIALLKANFTSDTGGGAEIAYVPEETVWAAREIIAGTKILKADALRRTQRIRFTIRTRQNMSLIERIIYDGRMFEVISLSGVGPNDRYLSIIADEVGI